MWAAGDCVESVQRLSGQRVVVALGTHANKQGRVIGVNIGGGYATFPGVIGTAVTKVCELEVARTGLSAAEADTGYRYVTASVDSTTRAGYFPAIWNEMGVDEILGLDLSYAPPFAPVWDPVLIAARKAFDAVEADTHT